MVAKRVWLGYRGFLEAFVYVALSEPSCGGSYMPLPKKNMILNIQNRDKKCLRWSIRSALFPASRGKLKKKKQTITPGFHRVINSRNKIRILQSMCWDGKKKNNVIVHRISEKKGDNTLHRLTALLYDQSLTFNSKHCCERCLHG